MTAGDRDMRLFRRITGALLIFTLVTVLFCACGEAPEPPDRVQLGGMTGPEVEQPALPPEETPEAGPTETTELVTAEETGTDGTDIPEPESMAEPTPEPTPEPRAERVTDDWFADAAFFGNSLVDGLHRFGNLTCGDFYAGTSASVLSVGTMKDAHLSDGAAATLLDALLEKQYQKIYVLLGINELGFTVEGFVDLYAELLDTIAAAEENAALYIMSLTPITEQRSNNGDLFTREKVLRFNQAIREMAEEKGYTYLDLYSAMADENGWLPSAESTDGVHFTPDKYLEWSELMRLNYDGCAPESVFQN